MTLNSRKVGTAGPGKHGDGRGLFLYVKPSGARSWVLRYQVQGRRRDLGLGAYPDVTLAMARDRALEARRLIAEGEDPIACLINSGGFRGIGSHCPPRHLWRAMAAVGS